MTDLKLRLLVYIIHVEYCTCTCRHTSVTGRFWAEKVFAAYNYPPCISKVCFWKIKVELYWISTKLKGIQFRGNIFNELLRSCMSKGMCYTGLECFMYVSDALYTVTICIVYTVLLAHDRVDIRLRYMKHRNRKSNIVEETFLSQKAMFGQWLGESEQCGVLWKTVLGFRDYVITLSKTAASSWQIKEHYTLN